MSRADESKSQREIQMAKLRQIIEAFQVGAFISGDVWYGLVQNAGLVHSHRQRLSDLREIGLCMDWNRTRHGFIYNGFQQSGQQELFSLTQ